MMQAPPFILIIMYSADPDGLADLIILNNERLRLTQGGQGREVGGISPTDDA
jgi:hypothetical protein